MQDKRQLSGYEEFKKFKATNSNQVKSHQHLQQFHLPDKSKFHLKGLQARMTQNNSPFKRSALNLSIKRKHSQNDSSDNTSLSRGRETAKSALLSPAPVASYEEAHSSLTREMVDPAFPTVDEREGDGAECNKTESDYSTIDSRITTPI